MRAYLLPWVCLIAWHPAGAADVFDATVAKNKLRVWHTQLAGESRPEQRTVIARQMLEVTAPLVRAEPDGIGGWLLHAEAAVAAKETAACVEALSQLERLHAATSGHPLAAPILGQIQKSGLLAAKATADSAATTSPPNGVVPIRDRLTKLPSGDQVLAPLPLIKDPVMLDNVDMFSLGWLQLYFDWKVDVKALVKKRKEDVDSEKFDPYQFITGTLAQVGHVRVKTVRKFDKNTAMRELNSGHPLLVWRTVTNNRESELLNYMKKHDADPAGTAPAPTDAAARKTWPVWSEKDAESGACDVEISLIYGCNEKRGEFIYLNACDVPENYHLRMSAEELSFTVNDVFLFD